MYIAVVKVDFFLSIFTIYICSPLPPMMLSCAPWKNTSFLRHCISTLKYSIKWPLSFFLSSIKIRKRYIFYHFRWITISRHSSREIIRTLKQRLQDGKTRKLPLSNVSVDFIREFLRSFFEYQDVTNVPYLVLLFSYEMMLKTWSENPSHRPSFAQLERELEKMLSSLTNQVFNHLSFTLLIKKNIAL